jgi:transcription antitermination factor NusG
MGVRSYGEQRMRPLIRDWYCVQANSYQEVNKALASIAALGFEVFAPSFSQPTPTTIRLQKPPISRLVFGSYFFVRFHQQRDHWRSIWSAPGVKRIFSASAQQPLIIRTWLIKALQEFYNPPIIKQARVRLIKPSYPDGSLVKIKAGSWQGFTGLVEKTEEERIIVLLSLFGQNHPTSFPRDDVQAA